MERASNTSRNAQCRLGAQCNRTLERLSLPSTTLLYPHTTPPSCNPQSLSTLLATPTSHLYLQQSCLSCLRTSRSGRLPASKMNPYFTNSSPDLPIALVKNSPAGVNLLVHVHHAGANAVNEYGRYTAPGEVPLSRSYQIFDSRTSKEWQNPAEAAAKELRHGYSKEPLYKRIDGREVDIRHYNPNDLDREAWLQERETPPKIGNGPVGTYVLLHDDDDYPDYYFGRSAQCAVLVPAEDGENTVGRQHFHVFPDRVANAWCLEVTSTSPTLAVVNNVYMQAKSNATGHRYQIFLNPEARNVVKIEGIVIYIYPIRLPSVCARSSLSSDFAKLEKLGASFGATNAQANEASVDDRLLLRKSRIRAEEETQIYVLRSHKLPSQSGRETYLALDPFNGEHLVAHILPKGYSGHKMANDHFELVNGLHTILSIARFRKPITVKGVPILLGEYHQRAVTLRKFMNENAQELNLEDRHRGALWLMKSLLNIVETMHETSTAHNNLSMDTVLVHDLGRNGADLCLTGFSNSIVLEAGDTTQALFEFDLSSIVRVVAQFLRMEDIPGRLRGAHLESPELDQDNHAWHTHSLAQKALVAARRTYTDAENYPDDSDGLEFDRLGNKVLDAIAKRDSTRAAAMLQSRRFLAPPVIHPGYTLGHLTLDRIVNEVSSGIRAYTVSDVNKIVRSIGGNKVHYWSQIKVLRNFYIPVYQRKHGDALVKLKPLLDYVLCCIDMYPDHRKDIVSLCKEYVPDGRGTGFCTLTHVDAFARAFARKKPLPSILSEAVATYRTLQGTGKEKSSLRFTATFYIWYHQPSRMFNLTQLLCIAHPDYLHRIMDRRRAAYPTQQVPEIQGDPRIRGRYALIRSLEWFMEKLHLRVPDREEILRESWDQSAIDQTSFANVDWQAKIILMIPHFLDLALLHRDEDIVEWCGHTFPLNTFEQNFCQGKQLNLPANRSAPRHWSIFPTDQPRISLIEEILAAKSPKRRVDDRPEGGFKFSRRNIAQQVLSVPRPERRDDSKFTSLNSSQAMAETLRKAYLNRDKKRKHELVDAKAVPLPSAKRIRFLLQTQSDQEEEEEYPEKEEYPEEDEYQEEEERSSECQPGSISEIEDVLGPEFQSMVPKPHASLPSTQKQSSEHNETTGPEFRSMVTKPRPSLPSTRGYGSEREVVLGPGFEAMVSSPHPSLPSTRGYGSQREIVIGPDFEAMVPSPHPSLPSTRGYGSRREVATGPDFKSMVPSPHPSLPSTQNYHSEHEVVLGPDFQSMIPSPHPSLPSTQDYHSEHGQVLGPDFQAMVPSPHSSLPSTQNYHSAHERVIGPDFHSMVPRPLERDDSSIADTQVPQLEDLDRVAAPMSQLSPSTPLERATSPIHVEAGVQTGSPLRTQVTQPPGPASPGQATSLSSADRGAQSFTPPHSFKAYLSPSTSQATSDSGTGPPTQEQAENEPDSLITQAGPALPSPRPESEKILEQDNEDDEVVVVQAPVATVLETEQAVPIAEASAPEEPVAAVVESEEAAPTAQPPAKKRTRKTRVVGAAPTRVPIPRGAKTRALNHLGG
ncbi:hypothetical protein BU16DRAFT_566205 [Lophium mytilinum]|uniref:FHA domain-containing protein n=1 Tax=Lophium mytilinum TaxID=390894 RepID=A0A6A6QCM4_9PEZI|nr:hypothetical protein BU16DRAFT_566205 [Lophium mytilinum]